MKSGTCMYCGSELSGPYCSQCGMSQAKKEIRISSFISLLVEYLTNWERTMTKTLWKLVVAPGEVSQLFIAGIRDRYYHPIKFLLFWGSINFMVSRWLNAGAAKYDDETNPISRQLMMYVSDYGSFLWLLCLPFVAAGTYILFRKQESKFLHHCVVAAYLIGCNLLLSIPFIIVEGLWPHTAEIRKVCTMLFLLTICMYFPYRHFECSPQKGIFAGILVYASAFVGILFWLVLGYLVLFLIQS